jgi:cell division protein FtsW
MIYSSSSIYAWQNLGDSTYFLKRHIFYIVIGLMLTLFVMSIDYHLLEKYSKSITLISLLLLVLVLIPGIGKQIAGARRWIRFWGIGFQPSELAQLAVIIYTAGYLSRDEKNIKDFIYGFMPVTIVLGLFAILILLQPDLGTAVAIVIIIFLILFISGVKFLYLVGFILLVSPALYFLIFNIPYRRVRIMSFLNPWADPQGSGFQLIQSQLALGSGGIFGVGLGQGKQKLFYLPAAHTDFIFSIIGEELGLIGTSLLIILFIIFIWLAYRIAKNASDKFGYYLSVGIIIMIALETIVNIGVSTGSIPTKGLPLPFISYGGTSLVFNMMSVGLLLNISKSKDE